MIIGVTGRSGVGKTTAVSYLKSLGACVIDADLLTHALYTENSAVVKDLAAAFGNGILQKDGELNRRALGRIAFATKENTQKLNEITHPAILQAIREKAKGESLVFVDGATIIESGFYKECDKLLVIVSDASKERIMTRDGLNEKDALLRLGAQKEDDFYTIHADYVIENNGSLSEFEARLSAFWQEMNR